MIQAVLIYIDRSLSTEAQIYKIDRLWVTVFREALEVCPTAQEVDLVVCLSVNAVDYNGAKSDLMPNIYYMT